MRLFAPSSSAVVLVLASISASSLGAVISGSSTSISSSPAVNLTSGAPLDWAKFGVNNASTFDHKNGGTGAIGTVSGPHLQYTNSDADDPMVGHSWSDGSPTASGASDATTAQSFPGASFQAENLSFSVTSNGASEELSFYVNEFQTTGTVSATLSGATSFSEVYNATSSSTGNLRVFTLDFQSAHAGDFLTVTIAGTSTSGTNSQFANLALGGAKLISIPEPSSLLLFGVCTWGLLARRGSRI